jgi:hypothetical protein
MKFSQTSRTWNHRRGDGARCLIQKSPPDLPAWGAMRTGRSLKESRWRQLGSGRRAHTPGGRELRALALDLTQHELCGRDQGYGRARQAAHDGLCAVGQRQKHQVDYPAPRPARARHAIGCGLSHRMADADNCSTRQDQANSFSSGSPSVVPRLGSRDTIGLYATTSAAGATCARARSQQAKPHRKRWGLNQLSNTALGARYSRY